MKFSRRNKLTFYTLRFGEAFLVGLIISGIFSLPAIESIIMIVTGLILTPVGFAYAKKPDQGPKL
jgi:hypothetical protein